MVKCLCLFSVRLKIRLRQKRDLNMMPLHNVLISTGCVITFVLKFFVLHL